MLLVFLMASVIAINLYMQMPRAAFEAQRAREEMLQERGAQYIRAIQLYVAKWRRYPPDIDALEKTNNVRFLRKRYKDPMTGKDEWRAIHVNAAGQLTDSIVQKQPGEEKKQYNNTFISELPTVGATAGTGAEAQNIALRRRPSDQGQPMPGMPGSGPQDPQAMQNGIPGMPQPGQAQPGQPQPGQPQPGQLQPGQPGVPGQTDPNGQPLPPSVYGQPGEESPPAVPPGQQPNPNYQPGQFNPNFPPDQQPNPYGRPVQPGQQPNPYGPPVQPGQQPPQPGQPQTPNYGMPYPVPTPPGGVAGNPGAAPAPQGPQQPGAPGANQGLDMINKILTTPRGGMNMAIPGVQGLQIGGGIAGFASLAESPSIKVYNERQKYNEWEFVYDMKKDKRLLGSAAGMAPNQPNNPLGNTQNNPLGGMPNPLTGNPPPNTPQSNAPGNSFGQNPFGGQNSGGFNQRGNQPTTPNKGFSQPRTR